MKHTIYGILKTWSSNKNRHLIDKLILKGNVTGTEVLDILNRHLIDKLILKGNVTGTEVLDILKGMAPTLNIPPDKDTPLHILEQILGDEDINMIRNVGRNY